MDYEKKYKEALELARVAAFNGHQSLMEGIFPELAESEDEKTRKEIIYHIKNCDDTIDEETEKRMIAWLENIPYTIDHEKREGFHLGYKAGLEKQGNDNKEYWRGYREGKQEILDKYAELEKQGEQEVNEPDWCHHKVDLSDCSEEYRKAYYDGWNNCNQQHSQCNAKQKPATMSIDEAIEHCKEKSCGNNACALEHKQLEKWPTELKELKEQKPAWSEKDEKEYKYVLKFVDNILNNCGNKKDYDHCKRCYDWLKSLKQRIGG